MADVPRIHWVRFCRLMCSFDGFIGNATHLFPSFQGDDSQSSGFGISFTRLLDGSPTKMTILMLHHCSSRCYQLSHCVLIERTQATHAMMEQAVFLATSSAPSSRAGMKVQDEIAASDGGCCFYQVTNNEIMNRVDGDLPRTS